MHHGTHTRNHWRRRFGGAVAVVAMTATACGGGSDDEAGAPAESVAPVTTAAPADEPADSEPVDTEPVATEAVDAAPVDSEPADSAPVDTEPAVDPGPTGSAAIESPAVDATFGESIDLAEIGALVQLHADAYESGIDPLLAAVELSGFPIDLQPPAEGPFFNFDVDITTGGDDRLKVDWDYGIENASAAEYTLEPGRTIPSGPPLDLIEATYVEQWAGQGLVFQNDATFTDDRHPSGQGNTQLYYKPEGVVEIQTPAGVGELVTVGAAAWGDFDDRDAVAGETPQPGYQQFVSASFDQGIVPVPIIAALLEAVPATAGMTLDSADLYTKLADPAGSFGEFGARSLYVRVKYEVPAADFDAVTSHFAANPFDPSLIRYAKIDQFAEPPVAEDDTFDPTSEFLSVKLLLNDTYPGSLSMSAPDAGDETFDVRIEFDLEPLRTPLG